MNSQKKMINIGVNVTGLEKYWEKKDISYKTIILDIDSLHALGIQDIRLPIAFEYWFNKKSKNSFIRDLKKIIKHVKRKNMTLILCYFDDSLDKKANYTNSKIIKNNWKFISKKLKKYSKNIYYEILNEPNLYPAEWNALATILIKEIRKQDKKTKLLVGATNYNSIYELSRKKPFQFKNIIYVFHFYEPFIFTHQGATWTGNQTKTKGIPYPYNSFTMPKINKDVIDTAGEVNFNDYSIMGNSTSLQHKIDIIKNWAISNNVEIWCTEFGAIETIDNTYRCNYFLDVISIFKANNIRSYLWEYNGNFGIKNSLPSLDCLHLF